jgi:hypothetical protein
VRVVVFVATTTENERDVLTDVRQSQTTGIGNAPSARMVVSHLGAETNKMLDFVSSSNTNLSFLCTIVLSLIRFQKKVKIIQ